jgi:hypothetical protein
VTFKDGATTLGTGTLNTSGYATFSTSGLSLGPHTITAVYSGDTYFTTSTSPGLAQTVNQGSTTTVVNSSANPSVVGQTITLTATVGVTSPASGFATGTVTFKDGATTLGTGTLNASGYTTFNTSGLALGSHSITAVYGGSAKFTGSTSAASTQTVNQASTSTVVASSVNPSLVGQSVTFTATVSAKAPASGIAAGTVTFKDGATTLGTGVLNASGYTTFSTYALILGGHSITAVYGGSASFGASSSAAVSQTINQGSSKTVLASSYNPSASGLAVTFTATVSAVAPANGTATGTVTFKDGTTVLGTGTLTSAGYALYTTAGLSLGTHTLTAVYGGDSNFTGSTSAALTQTVTAAKPTATAVVSSSNPSVVGQSVTFTATVTVVPPGTGTPTGSVTFKDGASTLGTSALTASGYATFSTSSLIVGSHSITAVYGGDSFFTTSTSSALAQAVNKGSISAGVSPTVNPSVVGQSVTFTGTVSVVAPAVGTPTGTLTFKDGATTLGTGTLNASGWTTFTTSSLPVGSHSITVVYSGDGNFNTATSPALSQTVNKGSVSNVLASSLNPSLAGQSVTFTATISVVAPAVGTPSGTVTFKDGTTTLGTSTLSSAGWTTFSTSTLTAGTHSITAVYGGDTNFASGTSPAVSQAVN